MWALLLIAVVATGLLTFAGQTWPGDMAAFFRPQIAGVTACFLLLAIALRDRTLSVAFAVLVLLAAVPLFLSPAPPAPDATKGNLRLVSANLLFDNPSTDRFGPVIDALAPDILVTQEAKFGWPKALRALHGLPYMAGPDVSRWNGNIVLSRFPLSARLVPDMPPAVRALGGGQAIRVEVDRPGAASRLVVYAIHAPTPRSLIGWKARNLYLNTIAERIAAEPKGTQVILAGDWNTPVWSPEFGGFFADSQLFATERTAWPAATRVFFGLGKAFGTAVDHVAVSRGIGVARMFTGEDFGSDHLPVVVDLNLPQADPG